MKLERRFLPACLALALAAGCASTKVTQRDDRIGDRKIPRPERILVFDFAATPAEVAPDSALAGSYDPQQAVAPKQAAEGHALGVAVAARLVEDIREMGMPAERASRSTPVQLNDILIRGNFVTIDEGNTAERMVIGFGAGSSKLTTVVEGYQATERGIRKLGSGTVESGGAKGPGAAVPAAVAIATANPIGLVVTTAVKAQGEVSGRSTIEGRATQTADEIAKQLRVRFEEQGWID